MRHNYIKLSNRSVQVDDIIFISEMIYVDERDKYHFDIIYADKNHIRLEYVGGDSKQAYTDKEMLESCLNYIDSINSYERE
jgi:hypothetical protein